MKKTYSDWMDAAKAYRESLDTALAENASKDILYYRGKYLFALRQAHKLNNAGLVPARISGRRTIAPISVLVNNVFQEHEAFINNELKENRESSTHERPTLSQEFGLKMRRLAAHASQANFVTGKAEKRQAAKNIGKDTLGLVGTALKTPFMLSARVMSAVGPLAVSILFAPLKLLSSFINVTAATVFETSYDSNFDHKVLNKMSDGLSKAVKYVSDKTYDKLGSL